MDDVLAAVDVFFAVFVLPVLCAAFSAGPSEGSAAAVAALVLVRGSAEAPDGFAVCALPRGFLNAVPVAVGADATVVAAGAAVAGFVDSLRARGIVYAGC